MTHTPTLIVGGGQAGLATAYELDRRGIPATILDANRAIGDAWRNRWDSLRLFTPAAYSSLPGLPFPGRSDHHPTKDEIADYLATYAQRFCLRVKSGVTVHQITRDQEGFTVLTDAGTWSAETVVIATGPFQTPVIPRLREGFSPTVAQLHSSAYRRPDQLPGDDVLVVGGGNSGCQIAEELHHDGRRVHLAVGARMTVLPQRVAGRDLFHWLDRVGYLGIAAESRLGRRLQTRDTIIGIGSRHLRRLGISVHRSLTGALGQRVLFGDVTANRVDAVVWATGVRRDHTFIKINEALDDAGALIQRSGITPVPGLFTVGQPWQTTRGSALLGFVGNDAARIADLAYARSARSRREAVTV